MQIFLSCVHLENHANFLISLNEYFCTLVHYRLAANSRTIKQYLRVGRFGGQTKNTITFLISDSLETCTVGSVCVFILYAKGRLLRQHYDVMLLEQRLCFEQFSTKNKTTATSSEHFVKSFK